MKNKTQLHPLAAGIQSALAGGAFLMLATTGFSAMAQEATTEQKAEENVEKIVVVGSRGAPRSVGDSAVPVDVISADEFVKAGPTDMMTLMSSVVPSFNVNSQPINDASTLVRPANLRGLPPDSTLVLVNGKRRHRSAVITFLGGGLSDGSQGPDISNIPSIALKQVEILRDGAAAQYGSDAIAGVINFRLKDASEGGTIELRSGQHYDGDGDLRQISANIGMPFTDNGFANFSTEFKQSDPTSRSVQRGDAAGLIAKGNTQIADPAQVWGSPEIKRDFKVFGNIGLEVAKNTEFYTFGNFAQRDVEGGFYFRNPVNRGGVYSNDGGDSLLVGNLDASKGSCSNIDIKGLNYGQINTKVSALPAHCFTFFSMLPGGFTPKFGGIVTDAALAGGVKGEMDNGWNYDLSSTYGRSEVEFYIKNTINASLGPSTPRDFNAGKYVQQEQAVNFDMNKLIEVEALPYPLAVAGGLEYRIDTFEIFAGDKNSFEVGPLASQGFGIGSNGFPGFKSDDAGSFNRYNYAAYTEFGAEFSDNFRSDFALRYENYEDFGTTTNAKLSARYQLIDEMALRGAISTGFRAPTIGQSMVRNVSTSFAAGKGLVDNATLPPTHPISVLKGGKALTPEESKNLSFGTVVEVDDFFATLDYFRIEVEDRISQSSSQELTAADVQALLALGVRDASSFAGVKYFTNDFDTTTQGLDFVANYGADLLGGRTTFALAANWTDTSVDQHSSNINEAKIKVIEDGLPSVRGSFTINHTQGAWRGYVRLNQYGSYFEDHADSGALNVADGGLPLNLGAEMTVDAEISYAFDEHYEISLGATNLFDELPDENVWADVLGAQYPTTAVMGFNGGFYYARMTYNF
ncbi:TonB-dependent receptor [Rheinheimera riviphila]|uniref:TonB-dependent receptor n=1 Tax=Rheinheimera riviphila TaxID=1834037 RepID=A0A437R2F7_9GAMM|nr:TonB-dependent receptor [Rheinheimera riviphila]RVU40941.1 TonB-dependent receptor [Rheinheimera riviphila]